MDPDDLTIKLPPLPEPDTILEVTKDGYLLDGKQVRKSDLRDELAKAARQGRKVLELRMCKSIKPKSMQFIVRDLGGVGFEHARLKVTTLL